ncbi:MAG: TonB-dependent receptor, partial [bacterium]|nr:TonB-dependent receptor [bacterium]
FITPVGGFNITVGLNYLNVFEVLNSFDVPFFGAANRRNILDKGNAIETKSIFTQVNYELSRQLTIVAGARIEQMPAYTIKGILNGGLQNESTLLGRYDYSKVGFIPRLALIYTPNKKHVINLISQ